MTQAGFQVTVGQEDAKAFAELSGDWNPLHTNPEYAAGTQFGRPILHGAFSAGLVSRMAGMYIPGTDCLLHGMQLKFLQPITPPARLDVTGKLVNERGETGRVEVVIADADSGRRYVEAWYEFGRHRLAEAVAAPQPAGATDEPLVLVTGASGGIGKALLARLGDRGFAVSRGDGGSFGEAYFLRLVAATNGARLAAIVHCGWPAPDNTRLTKLSEPSAAIDHNLAQPLQQSIVLARLLATQGTPDALLLLVGSTAADPGRHNYRMPLYTLAKGMIPALAKILAVELGPSGRRCAAAVFDVVDTGMNKTMSAQARLAHEDRSPAGRLPSANEAADQLAWILSNKNSLLSGATIAVSGGAIP